MTLTHRRILYLFFFAIFFALAPIIIKLAEGYKFNWQDFSWQKAGVLFLESKPEKADVFINGEKTDYETTARIKTILPGEYLVEVKKDGYRDWSKKLKINAGETTFAQYIRLFKQTIETEKISAAKILSFSNEQNGKVALAEESGSGAELKTLNLKNGEIKIITTLKYQPLKIVLEKSGSAFLLQKTSKTWEVLNQDIFGQNKFYPVPSSAEEIFQKIVFNENDPSLLFALSNLGLRQININQRQISTLVLAPVIDFNFVAAEKNLYFLKDNGGQTELLVLPNSNVKEESVISTLPKSQYKFFAAPEGLINFVDTAKNIAYFFDSKQKIFGEQKTTFNDISNLVWYSGGSPLIYGNDFELLTFDPQKTEKERKQLITRLGTKIKKFWWYPVPTHLFFLTDDGLFVTELVANNFLRDTINLNPIKDVSELWLSEKGDKIFWLNSQNELFVSQIQ